MAAGPGMADDGCPRSAGLYSASGRYLATGIAPGVDRRPAGFLRFLSLAGRCEERLAAAVPRPAPWPRSLPPQTLSKEQMRAFLSSFDRTAPTGRRDYATLYRSAPGIRLWLFGRYSPCFCSDSPEAHLDLLPQDIGRGPYEQDAKAGPDYYGWPGPDSKTPLSSDCHSATAERLQAIALLVRESESREE